MDNDKLNYDTLMNPYFANVKQEVDKLPKVLILHDTSQLDFSKHKTTKGLGNINHNNGYEIGLMLHAALAINADNKDIIGIINQKAFNRIPYDKSIKKGTKKYILSPKESDIWPELVNNIGNSNTKAEYVHIGDIGSDMFTFFKACLDHNTDFLVRGMHNRRLTDDDKAQNLITDIKSLSSMDIKNIEIPVKGTSKKRLAILNISYSEYKIKPSYYLYEDDISIYGIRVWEKNDNIDNPLEWILLTSIPIKNIEEAWEKVEWYKCRWLIEEYHKCLKTGCNIENRNFNTKDRIMRVLGILSPIAARLLAIKNISKKEPDSLAKNHIDTIRLKVLTKYKKLTLETLTIKQFWHSVASLGGFLGRKSDGNPGWQSIWEGWSRLQTMVDGVNLIIGDIGD